MATPSKNVNGSASPPPGTTVAPTQQATAANNAGNGHHPHNHSSGSTGGSHYVTVTPTTRFSKAELTLIGVSSYPKGAGGFVEVHLPEASPHATPPAGALDHRSSAAIFTTSIIPTGTHNFNVTFAVAIDGGTPMIELRFMRKRPKPHPTKPLISELGTYMIDLHATPSGLFTVPVTEAAGKLKFSLASWNEAGVPVHGVAAAGDGDDDDDLFPRLLPKFNSKTETGTITIAQLTSLAVELGIDCDAETLVAIVPAASQDSIYLEDCVAYLSQAIRDERDGENGTGHVNAGAAGGNGSRGEEISPFSYAWRKCQGTLPLEYTVSCAACLTARNLLFLSSFLIFTAVSAAIIAFCSISWLNSAFDRQSELLATSQNQIRIFMNSFERVSLAANSVSITDKTETLANWMLEHWRNEKWLVMRYEEKEAGRIAPLMAAFAAELAVSYIDTLADRVTALQQLLPTTSIPVPTSTIVDLVNLWRKNAPVLNARGEAVYPTVTTDDDELVKVTTFSWEWKSFVRHAGVIVASASDRYLSNAADPDATGGRSSAFVPFDQLESLACPTTTEYNTAPLGFVFNQNRTFHSRVYNIIATRLSAQDVNMCFVFTPEAREALSLRFAIERLTAADLRSSSTEDSTFLSDAVREELSLWTTDGAYRRAHNGQASPYAGTSSMNSNRLFVRTTPPSIEASSFCGTFATCDGLATFASQVAADGLITRGRSAIVNGDDGQAALVAGIFIPSIGATLIISRRVADQAAFFRKRQKDTFNFMNFEFQLTTELVLTGNDPITGAIIPQATQYRFPELCHAGQCDRFEFATKTAYASLASAAAGYQVRPDYRPEPCVSAYCQMGEEISVGVVIERDVQDLRSFTLANLVAIAEEINALAEQKAGNTYEMMIVRYDGLLTSKTFDGNDPTGCDLMFCVIREGKVIWREDCQHCKIRPTLTSNTSFVYRTRFRFDDQCSESLGGLPCVNANLQTRNVDLVRYVLQNNPREDETRTITSNDYRDKNVVASYVFLDNLSTSVIYKVDRETLEGPVILSITITAVVASACTLVGLIGVLYATTHVINKIDRDAEAYKSQVNSEKDKFAANISHLVPTHVAPRLKMIQQSVVVETSPGAVIVNVDMAGFGDLARGWSASKFVAFASYYYSLLNTLGKRHGLFNLKSFGDVFVAIGCFGRTDDRVREDAVLETAQFATVAVQLMSKEFSHNDAFEYHNGAENRRRNQRKKHVGGMFDESSATSVVTDGTDAMRNRAAAANGVDGGFAMPNIRVGCHTGPLVSGYIELGSTPRYDAFGASLQIASRMQATAGPGRIHCSQEFKDVLERADMNFDFEFDVQRRTILKGRVTHPSFMLRSAHVPVPEDLLAAFGISRAQQEMNFELEIAAEVKRRQDRDGSSSQASSRRSGKSMTSNVSRGSRQ